MTQNVGIVIVEYEIKEIDRGVNGERGRTMDTHKFFVEKMRFDSCTISLSTLRFSLKTATSVRL